MQITDLYSYPVKGLPGNPLEGVTVAQGCGLPNDRRYALALSKTAFDPENPVHMPKTLFLAQVKFERLARLQLDMEGDHLKLSENGTCLFDGNIGESAGRTALELFFEDYMKDDTIGGRPHFVEAAPEHKGHMFSDVPNRCLSIINLASLRELEKAAGVALDPRRFRANVYFDSTEPWAEMEWGGKIFSLGTVKIRGIHNITRCGATNVNPDTAERDQNLPLLLRKSFGHICLGLYGEVLEDGELNVGDKLEF